MWWPLARHKFLVKSPALMTWLASSRLQRRLIAFIILQDERTWLLRCSGWQQFVSLITDDSLVSVVAASVTGGILWHAIWSREWETASAGRWIAGHGSNHPLMLHNGSCRSSCHDNHPQSGMWLE